MGELPVRKRARCWWVSGMSCTGTLLQEMHHLSHAAQEAQASRSQVTCIGHRRRHCDLPSRTPCCARFPKQRLAVYQIDNQTRNRQCFAIFFLRVRAAPATVSPRSVLHGQFAGICVVYGPRGGQHDAATRAGRSIWLVRLLPYLSPKSTKLLLGQTRATSSRSRCSFPVW